MRHIGLLSSDPQRVTRAVVGVAMMIALAACGSQPDPTPSAVASSPTATPVATAPPPATASPTPSASAEPSTGLGPAGPAPQLRLRTVAAGLDAPVAIATSSADPGAIYVVEQVGLIRVVRDGRLDQEAVLDIRDRVTAGGEQGLLGLAFHPDPSDGRLFVYYTDIEGDQVVASFVMDPAGSGRALPESERVLLTMPDRYANHNGGAVVFGPDGYLYISTGDGGGGGDPLGAGGRLDTLLAKILRIDIDRPGADGAAYGIPSDNPFVAEPDARPEIWHTGLRNPWRMQFDRLTGDLWIGDVGQSAWEEIDRAPAGLGGLDFGWSLMEGFDCYPSTLDDCQSPDLTEPVTAYGHDLGCAVVGGSVYRGSGQPALAGWYVFADYCSGRVWVLDPTATEPVEPQLALDSTRNISAIGQDVDGELLVTDIAAGELLRIEVVRE